MALRYKILEKKPLIGNGDDAYMDLTVQTIDTNCTITGSFVVVNEKYVARPDLISLAVYGTDEYADILCKINGISNPFEMNENDIIIIPHVETMMEFCRVKPEPSKFVNNNEPQDILSNIANAGLQKYPEQRRSPNEQIVGEHNFILDKESGMVIY